MKRPTDAFWQQLAKLDAQLGELSYYQLMSMGSDVDDEALRQGYERQVRVLHPDRHARETHPDRQRALTRVYARMSEAYRVLSNPQQRAVYDRGLALGHTRFRENRTDHGPRADLADPQHAQARSLLEQAQALLAGGDTRGAKAKLQLALQYEPGSQALARALDACMPPPEAQEAPAKSAPDDTPDSSHAAASEFAERPPSRVHPRTPMGQGIKVSCKTWKQVQTFYMHNISRGGMLLRCNEPLPLLGAILELTVLMPDREPIDLPAEVVRHVPPREAGQRPGIGIKFLVVPEPVRVRFETLLRVAGLQSTNSEPRPAVAEPLTSGQAASESARRLIDAGKYSEACHELQGPVRRFPDDKALRSLFHLAAGLMARERSQEAAAHTHFERALRFDPDSAMVLKMLREPS